MKISEASGALCRCGQVGCLSALTSGSGMARAATAAAREVRSSVVSEMLADRGGEAAGLSFDDVLNAARRGDRTAVDLITRAGCLLGETLATLVSFYNPSLVVLGGRVAEAGDLLLAAVRESAYQRSLPLATRELQITLSTLQPNPGLYGAAEAGCSSGDSC